MSGDGTKKPGLISRFFSTRSTSKEEEQSANKRRLQRLHSVDVTSFRDKTSSGLFDEDGTSKPKKKEEVKHTTTRKQSMPGTSNADRKQSVSTGSKESKQPRNQPSRAGRGGGRPNGDGARGSGAPRKVRHRKAKSSGAEGVAGVKVDTSKPLEYPTTPEMIYEYHKRKPFLDRNEEWLVMELNEYECLVESLDVIRIIAKHSKFFEVEPDELWEEFFEFVEDVPSYDEIINYDVWQEFRDNRYPC